MTIYTAGTFDLLHFGHINLLKQCRKIAGPKGRVIVALNPDEFVEKYKKVRPVMSFVERKRMLEEISYVDQVIANEGGEDAKVSIEKAKPDMIVIGSDRAKKDYYKQMNFTQEWLDEHGIMLCYVPYTWEISTTDIKKRMAQLK